jgi:purine-binding chemotaxis protein CheW
VESTVTSNKKEFLTFELGKEEYAVEILRVQEIRGWENPDPLPNVPSYIKGVVDLRGTIVPIIDLREKFHLKVSYNVTTVVVVVHVLTKQGERIMGLVVDSVSDVQQFDVANLQPAPDISASIDSQFILGLTTVFDSSAPAPTEAAGKRKGRMVIVIDIDKLASEGLIEHIESPDHMPMGNG